MKKLICLLFTACFAVSAFAQGPAFIEAVWNNPNPNNAPLELAKVENGNLTTVSSYTLGDDKRAYFTFPVTSEGFYVLGTALHSGHTRYIFYFKPGDKLNVNVSEFTYKLEGKENTKENIEMAKWEEFMYPLKLKAYAQLGDRRSTFRDFFPLVEEKAKAAESYKASRTKNAKFDEVFPIFREFNFTDIVSYFMFTMRTEHPETPEQYTEWFRNVDVKQLSSTDMALNYPNGIDVLIRAQHVKLSTAPRTGVQTMEDMMLVQDPGLIVNPIIKGEMAVMFAQHRKTYSGIVEYENQFGQYLVTDAQKKAFDDIKNRLYQQATNRVPSVDFTYPDKDGNMISLSDFKGKVVYIDFWATWCGPCIAEMPHMKKLEAEYHNNPDMVFLGVSLDREKDKDKWLAFLEKEGMEGVQIFAGGNPDTVNEAYAITGIPRFMLIDKQGNVASRDALRPSSPEIRNLLDQELAK